MFVKFYNRPVATRKDENGLPFYENQVFVIIARDATNQVERRADEEDFDRFPETYAAFLKATRRDEKHEGLILEMWPLVTPADVENLKVHGFHTVQQLAKVNRSDQAKMPPHIGVLVTSAKNYVKVAGEVAKTAERVEELSRENANLREELGIVKAQLAAKENAAA